MRPSAVTEGTGLFTKKQISEIPLTWPPSPWACVQHVREFPLNLTKGRRTKTPVSPEGRACRELGVSTQTDHNPYEGGAHGSTVLWLQRQCRLHSHHMGQRGHTCAQQPSAHWVPCHSDRRTSRGHTVTNRRVAISAVHCGEG